MDIIDVSRVTSMCSGFTDEDGVTLTAYQTAVHGDDVLFELEFPTFLNSDSKHVKLTKNEAIELMAWLSEVTK